MKTNLSLLFVIIGLLFSLATTAQTSKAQKQLAFEEVDSLWRATPFLNNEIPESNRIMEYADEGNNLSGRVQYFENNTCPLRIVMCVVEMPSAMLSQRLSMQLMVDGQPIIIPEKISYQTYYDPKLVKDKVIIRCSVGLNPEGEYFYTVVDLKKKKENFYQLQYYSTPTLAQIRYEKREQ